MRMDPLDLTDRIKMCLCLWSKVFILKMQWHCHLSSLFLPPDVSRGGLCQEVVSVKGMSLWKGGICEAGGKHPAGMHYFLTFLSEFHFDTTFIIIYEATLWSFNQAKVKATDPS